MSIKSRIYLFQLVIGASVLLMAGIVYATLQSTDYYLKRVQLVHRQLETITSLQVSANRFSEQIAELLLIGEPERPDFESARAELEAGFDQLEKRIKGELGFVAGTPEGKEELDELYRLQRMRTLYGEINERVEQVLALREAGKLDEAITMFRREIENRLDAEFENLIQAAVLDEADEVGWVERRAEELWRWLTWTTAAAILAAMAFCFVAGLLLMRALIQPIKLLTAGTEAVSRGEFEHRIPYESSDELGTLARRFNEMAALQQEQRALLLEAQSNLERQVDERTRELGAANKRLTDLDRMRVQFLADISHELLTPLTALRGEAEVTLRHRSQPVGLYRETLERIVAQTSEMTRLVNDLLFLARSEADTIRFEPRRVVFQQLAAEAVREGEMLARAKGISIEADYPDDPAWIAADPQRLKQALMILLDNAIKYSKAGGSVRLRMTVAEGFAEVTVRDEGMGIPAEELPNVFERFYRGRRSGPSSQDGSGLGLAIAKWLVEKHGGEIAIRSEEGRFTEVRIRIARLEVAARVQDPVG
jgi:two-component system, OmpR family, sensor kinase